MEIIRLIFAPIWKIWFFIVFTTFFLILYPFFWYTITYQKLDMAYKLKRIWCYFIAYGSGVFPNIMYKSDSKKMPEPCVFVANHTSYLDIVLSPFYIDHLALYLGKAELLKTPLFNIFFKQMDIPVNRSSRVDAVKSLRKMHEEVAKGRSMVVFPEGTIPTDTTKTLPFKNGAFKLAIDNQVPIVPVVYLNNWKLMQNGGFFKSNGRPGIPDVIVFEPIETKGMTEANIEELKARVHKLTNDTLNDYYGSKN